MTTHSNVSKACCASTPRWVTTTIQNPRNDRCCYSLLVRGYYGPPVFKSSDWRHQVCFEIVKNLCLRGHISIRELFEKINKRYRSRLISTLRAIASTLSHENEIVMSASDQPMRTDSSTPNVFEGRLLHIGLHTCGEAEYQEALNGRVLTSGTRKLLVEAIFSELRALSSSTKAHMKADPECYLNTSIKNFVEETLSESSPETFAFMQLRR